VKKRRRSDTGAVVADKVLDMVPTGIHGKRSRLLVVMLASVFAVSACSVLGAGEPLAVVPELDPTDKPTKARKARTAAAAAPEAIAKPARTPKPTPAVKVAKLKPRPRRGPFSMNLYRNGDFVHQQNKNWCVAGSTQTMMNIMDSGQPNKSAGFQQKLYNEGRRLTHNQSKLTSIGVDLSGWSDLLSTNDYGRYGIDGRATRRGAIRTAAKALRETGRPVGLVVWRGAHSWVMSGFTATADPAFTDDFEVKTVFIQDVWYPYVSSIWGASRPPNSSVPVAKLAEDYLPYRRPAHRWPKRDGKFMLILPALPNGTVAG
jgi:hypothetical protein